jgi:hypothetical protein
VGCFGVRTEREGVRGWTPHREQERGRERGARAAWDSAGGAATTGSGPAVAWPRRAAGRTGGEGADRWAATTVPGGGTG